ncbi:hypothetical protein DFH09DRAFT_1361462 [Mycena vulgaris]|nr:hypothetical protein DFH09DRAFT_1361462 [Mycena vulgaris]
MSGQQNAEAGPSTTLFLKPQGPSPKPAPRLASTHDLLARFHLLASYDKYVRPPLEDGPDTGKGKAREQQQPHDSPAPQTPGAADDPDDDETGPKGEKKKKNSYKHLIKDIPGKHSMKKDDYLAGIMQAPPKQRLHIAPFDLRTQRDAFSVSLEGLKGWNPSALVVESAQAREDRKKRKELKRLAKAQAQLHAAQAAAAASTGTGSPAPGTPRSGVGAGTPRPGTGVGTPRPGVGTPRPARPTLPPVVVPGRVGTPLRTAGTTPTRGAGTPTSAHPRTGTPHPLSAQPLSAGAAGERGIKREREEGFVGGGGNGYGNGHAANGAPLANGNANGNANGGGLRAPVPVIAASKAGIPGVRPRPVKKQRVDMQGQARDVSAVQQQPTPQGV